MRLLIDAGNTRIKLALADGDAWQLMQPLPSSQAHELSARFAMLPDVRQVWVSNVAGDEVARHIRAACAARQWQPHFIAARAAQCGVRNGYEQPAQLGCDRWAALIAAWHQVQGACLVVNCGTATTIDALSAQGEFLGGLILPGIELMRRSLIGATAGLRPQGGAYEAFPRNTQDALFSGAIQACCGAIARQHALLDTAHAPVVLSGGAADLLPAHLNLPLRMADNLVLQGLLLIAQEESVS
ncbi:MAG TPA: type III pantothenate kinase [Gallionella sp.]|nr:type III pantothenate kinase [Gallionella sp.]